MFEFILFWLGVDFSSWGSKSCGEGGGCKSSGLVVGCVFCFSFDVWYSIVIVGEDSVCCKFILLVIFGCECFYDLRFGREGK